MQALFQAPKTALVTTLVLATAIAMLILMAPGTLHAATLTSP
jgi:hypothetical protein